jgi:hypothetical protein
MMLNILTYYFPHNIAVILSRSESFEVSVLQALGTDLPVVFPKTDGLTEVIDEYGISQTICNLYLEEVQ